MIKTKKFRLQSPSQTKIKKSPASNTGASPVEDKAMATDSTQDVSDFKTPVKKNSFKIVTDSKTNSMKRQAGSNPPLGRGQQANRVSSEQIGLSGAKHKSPAIPKSTFQLIPKDRTMVGGFGLKSGFKVPPGPLFIDVGIETKAGRSEGRTKTNQDSFVAETNVCQDAPTALLAVFDGHGLQGHRVSSFLVNNLRGTLI
jgi:hypothetical protein